MWVQLQAKYLNDVAGGRTRRPLHAGRGHGWVHGWRRELLLHARVGNLGTVGPLGPGLGAPRRHRLRLRVGAQGRHDGGSYGGGRGVAPRNLLDDGEPRVTLRDDTALVVGSAESNCH